MVSPFTRSTWGLVLANLAAVGCSWLFALVTRGQLPARYPVHFTAAGRPDRWASADSYEWFMVPLMAVVILAPILGTALALPRVPFRWWSLPRKDQLARLRPEQRAPVVRAAVHMMLLLALLTTMALLVVQGAMFRTALGGALSIWPALGVVGLLFLAVLVLSLRRLYLAVDRALRGE